MAEIYQATPYLASVLMVLSGDNKTGAVGKTVTVSISRAGGAFNPPSAGPTAVEIGFGWYGIPLLPADTLLLGDLLYHATATGCDDTDERDQVIPVPQLLTISNDLQTTNALLQQLVAGALSKELADADLSLLDYRPAQRDPQ